MDWAGGCKNSRWVILADMEGALKVKQGAEATIYWVLTLSEGVKEKCMGLTPMLGFTFLWV